MFFAVPLLRQSPCLFAFYFLLSCFSLFFFLPFSWAELAGGVLTWPGWTGLAVADLIGRDVFEDDAPTHLMATGDPEGERRRRESV